MDIASSTMNSLMMQVSTGGYSIELIAIGIAWIVLTAFGFALGASRLDAIALAVITAAFLGQFFASAWLVGGLTNHSIAVVGLFVLCYLIFMRLCDPGLADSGAIFSSALAAFAAVGTFVALWADSFTDLWPFPAMLAPYFGHSFTLWWIVGALIVLAILRQKRMWA